MHTHTHTHTHAFVRSVHPKCVTCATEIGHHAEVMGAKRSATRLIDLETVRFTGISEGILRISCTEFMAWVERVERWSHEFRGHSGLRAV